jgi:hypothetical protein
MKEPTSEQCEQNSVVFDDGNSIGYAIWYPQMGGYVGKAIVVMSKQWKEFQNGGREGGCFEAYVWHNGEFPFSEDDGEPNHIHHCDPDQFIEFGETVKQLNNSHKISVNK